MGMWLALAERRPHPAALGSALAAVLALLTLSSSPLPRFPGPVSVWPFLCSVCGLRSLGRGGQLLLGPKGSGLLLLGCAEPALLAPAAPPPFCSCGSSRPFRTSLLQLSLESSTRTSPVHCHRLQSLSGRPPTGAPLLLAEASSPGSGAMPWPAQLPRSLCSATELSSPW